MESKTKELVKAGHELVVLLGNQHGMIDAASLVQRLTAQLDITAAALREMTKKRDDEHADVLAWEKTMFKVCGEDGTKSVAAKFASLEAERDQLAAENAARKAAAKKVIKMNRQHAKDKHGNPDIAESWACVKALRQVNTPTTDAWQREQMARGVEKFAEQQRQYIGKPSKNDAASSYCSREAIKFSTQLRQGELS
ncbi:hypothetical protein [Pseudescherichia sp.]|uniref:hypothetical protein n=1 Tax=Pseudescherichia sp. TaxID=2055881 RepID=UPI0028AC51A0|nr:hypothetical protein [Pseudescherichia sp.]